MSTGFEVFVQDVVRRLMEEIGLYLARAGLEKLGHAVRAGLEQCIAKGRRYSFIEKHKIIVIASVVTYPSRKIPLQTLQPEFLPSLLGLHTERVNKIPAEEEDYEGVYIVAGEKREEIALVVESYTIKTPKPRILREEIPEEEDHRLVLSLIPISDTSIKKFQHHLAKLVDIAGIHLKLGYTIEVDIVSKHPISLPFAMDAQLKPLKISTYEIYDKGTKIGYRTTIDIYDTSIIQHLDIPSLARATRLRKVLDMLIPATLRLKA